MHLADFETECTHHRTGCHGPLYKLNTTYGPLASAAMQQILTPAHVQIMQQLVDLNVGEAIIAGMSAHKEDRDVQLTGCLITTNLAFNLNKWAHASSNPECVLRHNDPAKDTLWGMSARVAVGKARRRFADDVELTQWADQAMKHL